MITTENVEQAEARVTEARHRAAMLRKHGAGDAEDMVTRAVTAAADLWERKARQDEALKARKAAEKPHAAELRRLGKELDASADRLGTAAQTAAHALTKLIAAVTAHNGAVQAAHARLTELGLPLGDADVAEYESGAGRAGELRLLGEHWGPAPADTVAQFVISRVMGECFGPNHPGARIADIRVHSFTRGGAGKLADRLTAA
ncbi:hypothetical protein [Streptomyces sp. NPDC002187]|uniref:hypothetical protein n=1 Tax=Streptomyces sp. NPDC002187 TaxID=3364637 RepID=UPI0036A8EE0D